MGLPPPLFASLSLSLSHPLPRFSFFSPAEFSSNIRAQSSPRSLPSSSSSEASAFRPLLTHLPPKLLPPGLPSPGLPTPRKRRPPTAAQVQRRRISSAADEMRPSNLKKRPFTPEEEDKIIELQAQLGNKWAKIAAHLQERSNDDIKNFWYSRERKRHSTQKPACPSHKPESPSTRCHTIANGEGVQHKEKQAENKVISTNTGVVGIPRIFFDNLNLTKISPVLPVMGMELGLSLPPRQTVEHVTPELPSLQDGGNNVDAALFSSPPVTSPPAMGQQDAPEGVIQADINEESSSFCEDIHPLLEEASPEMQEDLLHILEVPISQPHPQPPVYVS